MEQSPAYAAINFNLASGGPSGLWNGQGMGPINGTGLGFRVSSYVCPSDQPQGPDDGSGRPHAQTSYAPSGGTWNVVAYFSGPDCWQQDPGNGAFDDMTAYGTKSFRDVLSQTLFVGETSRFPHDPDNLLNQWSRPGYYQVSAAFDPTGTTVRPQGFAFEVPRINAPMMQGDYPGGEGGPGGSTTPGPHPLPPGTDYPDASDYKAWLNNIAGLSGIRPVGLPEQPPRRRQLPPRRRLRPVHQSDHRPRHFPRPRDEERPRGRRVGLLSPCRFKGPSPAPGPA